jgi:ER-bound oxygenase mpaB/B'/Rubber oxygenase, catalytic domain
MRYLTDYQATTYEHQPTEVQDFLKNNSSNPAFVDSKLMQAGLRFFWQHAQPIALTLGCYSLPYCYAAANGAQVLWLSERIKKDTFKRLEETGEFVFGVMQERDWPNGKNIIKILKIRLLHAVVRWFTLHSQQWDNAWGFPVNQEDMAGTNLAFSYIVIRGLRKSGITTDEAGEEAYLHLWNVIGALMGVNETLLPLNLREAYHLDRVIVKRQFRPSEAGAGLTKALLETLQKQVPSNALVNLPAAQMRFLLGDAMADLLALPQVPLEQRLVKLTTFPIFPKNLLFSAPPPSDSALSKYLR